MTISVFASGANRSARPYVFASGANRVLREVWVFQNGANRRTYTAFSISVSPTSYSTSLNTTNGTRSWQQPFSITATGVGPFTYSWSFVSGGTGIALNGTTSATCTASGSGSGDQTQSGTLRCTVHDTALIESLYVDIPISVTYLS